VSSREFPRPKGQLAVRSVIQMAAAEARALPRKALRPTARSYVDEVRN